MRTILTTAGNGTVRQSLKIPFFDICVQVYQQISSHVIDKQTQVSTTVRNEIQQAFGEGATTFSITTQSIIHLIVTLSIKCIKHNDAHHKH